jgi:hypothetical protein
MEKEKIKNAKPPIMGSWRNLYFVVLGFNLILILIFTWLTNRYK